MVWVWVSFWGCVAGCVGNNVIWGANFGSGYFPFPFLFLVFDNGERSEHIRLLGVCANTYVCKTNMYIRNELINRDPPCSSS